MSKLKEIGIRWEENGELHFSHVYLKSEADKVIAEKDKEIRRLKRALYKALANWAHEAKFDYDDDFGPWDNMEHKCLKKAEEYK